MKDQDQTQQDRQARDIFLRAVEIHLPEAQAAYIEGACQHDASLRSRVEVFLGNHRKDSFLETAAISGPPKAISPAAPSECPGTVIGPYTLLQMIGDGGFGAVYMAEQKEPVRRRVALKIIKLGMDTQQVVARFEAERQALALMDHPNIAKVLDGGATGQRSGVRGQEESDGASPASDLGHLTPDSRLLTSGSGRPYFVMELVKGQTVMKYCDDHQLSTRQRLELFIPICQAIQHAHQKGIIHRDIKPSNILVATIDGRPVPKVIDFGIAKATQHDLTDKIVFTQFHQFMGTPAYMSPEQAAMDSSDIDTRSDIYSLGVLLYELLTGKTPVESKELTRGGYDEIRRRIREIEPPTPSNRLGTLTNDELTTVARSRAIEPARLAKLIRGELDWVVLKAMDKDRSRRYETASAFALDIQRYLDNEPVTAVKPSPIYHFQKFARRHKAALATAACFVLLLTVGVCVATAQAITNKSLFTAAEEARLNELSAKERETELRRIAVTERGQAEIERDRSQSLLYIAHMNLAQRAWDNADGGRVAGYLDMYRPQPGRRDVRNFEWFYLDRTSHSELLTFKGHTSDVLSVAFSPDGKRMASSSWDQTIKVWDATSGQEAFTLRGHTNAVFSVAFSPDGKRLASASRDQTVKVWDATTGQEMLTLKGHTNEVFSVAFSPDGKWLASGSGYHLKNLKTPGEVNVWDARSGEVLLTLKGHSDSVNSVSFSADGKRLASASDDTTVKVWDATSGQDLLTIKGHTGGVTTVTFSADGKWLASACWAEIVKVWDATSGQETLTLQGHVKGGYNAVSSLAFSADGKRLAAAGWDNTVKVWDPTTGQETLVLKGHEEVVSSVAFSPDGKRLASASFDKTVKVWDATIDQESLTLNGHSGSVKSVAFSPDRKRLASAGTDRTVKVWDAESGLETLTWKGHSGAVHCVSFSPDGKRLASASADKTVKVWDATSGQEVLTFSGHANPVMSVAFSPDGKMLVSAAGQTVKLWDATTGQETLTLKGHTCQVSGVAFSPDGKRLASSSGEIYGANKPGEIKVWDVTTGQETLVLKGHEESVHSVVFSPDGKQLVSAGQSFTMKVWDAMSGLETHTLKGHLGSIMSVAFSPDGKRLVSASWDDTVKVWDATTGLETLTLKGHASHIHSVAFSPDGNRLASAGDSGTVKMWDARPRSEARTPGAKTD